MRTTRTTAPAFKPLTHEAGAIQVSRSQLGEGDARVFVRYVGGGTLIVANAVALRRLRDALTRWLKLNPSEPHLALRAALGKRAECEICHRVWAVQGLLEDHRRCPGCHSGRVTLGASVSAPAAPGGPEGRPDGPEHR